jgi:hypothetical protein
VSFAYPRRLRLIAGAWFFLPELAEVWRARTTESAIVSWEGSEAGSDYGFYDVQISNVRLCLYQSYPHSGEVYTMLFASSFSESNTFSRNFSKFLGGVTTNNSRSKGSS